MVKQKPHFCWPIVSPETNNQPFSIEVSLIHMHGILEKIFPCGIRQKALAIRNHIYNIQNIIMEFRDWTSMWLKTKDNTYVVLCYYIIPWRLIGWPLYQRLLATWSYCHIQPHKYMQIPYIVHNHNDRSRNRSIYAQKRNKNQSHWYLYWLHVHSLISMALYHHCSLTPL